MRNFVIFLVLVAITAIPLTAQNGQLVLPHFAADKGSFSTKITLENRSKMERNFSLRYLTDQGRFLSMQSFTLASGERQIIDVPSFDGTNPSHAIFDFASDLFAGITFTPTGNTENPIFIEAISDFSKRWRVYPSNWNQSFDGLAIVNPSCFENKVRIRLFSAEGELIDEIQSNGPLSNGGKWLLSLEDTFTYQVGSYLEVEGDQGLAVMAIKGNRDFQRADSFLVGNLAVPYSTYEDMRVELRENREKWARAGFGGTYTIEARKLCFCLPEFAQPVTMEVSDFQLDSLTYADSGDPVELGRISEFFTIESLFNLIEDSFNRKVANVYVEYDQATGYPIQVSIDYDACIVDEEITYRTELKSSSKTR